MTESDRPGEKASEACRRAERRAMLRDLARQSQEIGTYGEAADEYEASLAEARARGSAAQ